MHFFDTHLHLQDFGIDNAAAVISQLQKAGIDKAICVSAKESDWEKAAFLAENFPNFAIPAFAIHPWYVGDVSNGWEKKLEKMLNKYPQALLGECGFDRLKNQDFNLQAHVFDMHLKLAKKYHRTLLIHAVKAWDWLERYWTQLPKKFVFHSFNARPSHLDKILKYGGYIAVNEKFLKNKTAEEILHTVPNTRLLLESDAPYQGKAKDIPALCLKIATIRQENIEDLAFRIYNASLEIINNE